MLKRIKNLFKDNTIYFAVAITVTIGALSLIKFRQLPVVSVSHLDKIEHGIAYAILTLSWLLNFKNSFTNKRVKYITALSCVFYGIVLEVLQTTMTTYRTASWLDILANSVGVFIALIVFDSVYKKIHAI